jgi:superfamily II DNA/RNA helicase
MFISQPRRIAAKALVERVRSTSSEARFRPCFALRMGHGYREYESSQSQAWFVTTGYLTRFMANHVHEFDSITHVVIDEVHERSVDTDILCWLCRRLLATHPHIRLVLMSATLATKLYQDYFTTSHHPTTLSINNMHNQRRSSSSVSVPPIIHVGVKRFSITEHFLEHFLSPPFSSHFTPNELQGVQAVLQECESTRCRTAPSPATMMKRHHIVARLVAMVGQPGSSVLIFVPGMNEIIAITELLEEQQKQKKINNNNNNTIGYRIFPIHSDIPFEDQMAAFEDETQAPPKKTTATTTSNGEVDDQEEEESFQYGLQQHAKNPTTPRTFIKVIIATNAAESSVTLPNVDHVICLGLCRQIIYNAASHRQVLVPTWISRASAKQRAGRTGRLRPGHVYRLYTRTAYESYLEEFEDGEMRRIPLDQVILTLKELLQDQKEAVIPVLQGCIEPPAMDTIERSFQSLYRWNFISAPNDDKGDATITRLGSFVSALGIDLALGSLIGLGIQFGIAAEVIELAATLSFPKSPFQLSNPLIHDPHVYNDITSATYQAKCHFDANLYSDPMALMNVLWDYDMVTQKTQFCKQYRLAMPRLQQLVSTRNSLRTRVADFLGINVSHLQVTSPPAHMPPAKITILRILQVWVFSDTLIECAPVPALLATSSSSASPQQQHPAGNDDASVLFPLMVAANEHGLLTDRHLEQVLDGQHRHPYQLLTIAHIDQQGEFEYNSGMLHGASFCLSDFVGGFEKRLLSYAIEKYGDQNTSMLIWSLDEYELNLYCHNSKGTNDFKSLVDRFYGDVLALYNVEQTSLVAREQSSSTNRRGILERKCGMWSIHAQQSTTMSSAALLDDRQERHFQKYCITGGDEKRLPGVLHDLLIQIAVQNSREVKSILAWDFRSQRKGKKSHAQLPHFKPTFLVSSRGEGSSEIGKLDLKDLLGLGSANHLAVVTTRNVVSQSVLFPPAPNQPILYHGKERDKLGTSFLGEETSSWNRSPLFSDIAEGARLLAVLASGQRRCGQLIHFSMAPDGQDGDDQGNKRTPKKKKNSIKYGASGDGEMAPTLTVKLKDETKISQRWKRLGTDRSVYVQENTVPASATSVDQVLFCCCANALEVKGGGLRVEGLTVLPPNPLFLLLCLMSFGLLPNSSITDILARHHSSMGDETITNFDDATIEKGMLWLESRLASQKGRAKNRKAVNDEYHFGLSSFQVAPEAAALPHPTFVGNDRQNRSRQSNKNAPLEHNNEPQSAHDVALGEVMVRLKRAVDFHKSCASMGEELICFKDKIHAICQLFDSVGGQAVSAWSTLDDTSLTPKNLKLWRQERRIRKDEPRKEPLSNQTATATNPLDVLSSMIASASLNDRGPAKSVDPQQSKASAGFSVGFQAKVVTTNSVTASVAGKEEWPETAKERFIRGSLVKRFPEPVNLEATRLFATQLGPGEQIRPDELVSTNILSLLVQSHSDLVLGQASLEDREAITKKRVVCLNHESWVIMRFKDTDGRELYQAKFVNDLIPVRPLFGRGKNQVPKWMKKHPRPSRIEDVEACIPPTVDPIPKAFLVRVAKDGHALLFETIADALRMEAAFWLELQFCSAGKSSIRHWYDHSLPEMIQFLRKDNSSAVTAPVEN